MPITYESTPDFAYKQRIKCLSAGLYYKEYPI